MLVNSHKTQPNNSFSKKLDFFSDEEFSTAIITLQNENKYLQEERSEYEKTIIKNCRTREPNKRADVGCSQTDERTRMQQ